MHINIWYWWTYLLRFIQPKFGKFCDIPRYTVNSIFVNVLDFFFFFFISFSVYVFSFSVNILLCQVTTVFFMVLVNDNKPGWYICLCLTVWSQLWCMEQWLLERQTHSLQTTPRLRWLLLISWCSSTEFQSLTMPQRTETSRYSFLHALEHQNTQYAQNAIKRFLIDLRVLGSLPWN